MTDLSTAVLGIRYPNPFLLASGPPGTNAAVIKRAFALGWGGIVAKTICLDAGRIVNTVPRYGRLHAKGSNEVIGFENIELISDRPFAVWMDELQDCAAAGGDRVLIASIMEEYSKDAWHEIVERTQATGVKALELNFSCPHGLPEQQMGAAMGMNPAIVREVTSWVKQVARIPVYAKMTPNVADPAAAARAALDGGADGVTAINTVLCVIGVDLETLRPIPTVEGYSEPGGYSGPAIRPIALRHVLEIARACPGAALSAAGGIESGADAAQFLLLGASTVQLCTAPMLKGCEIIDDLCAGLAAFMDHHGIDSVAAIVGRSLPYFDTHQGLVARQRRSRPRPAPDDGRWQGDIVREARELTAE